MELSKTKLPSKDQVREAVNKLNLSTDFNVTWRSFKKLGPRPEQFRIYWKGVMSWGRASVVSVRELEDFEFNLLLQHQLDHIDGSCE